MRRLIAVGFLLGAVGCGGGNGGGSSGGDDDADAGTVTTPVVDDGTGTEDDDSGSEAPDASAWIVNTTGETSMFVTDGGTFVEVNVLSVSETADTISVETNAIPGYVFEVTQPILDWYNDYQAAAYSSTGVLNLGDTIEFGKDIGLSVSGCAEGGDGWWPAGGAACADSEQGIVFDFPATPTLATDECATGLGPVGLWVSGVIIYDWQDGFTHNNEGVWSHYALPFRSKGMDICLGHAGGGVGQYHHHSFNECLRQEVGDEGMAHSPVYGFAGDGFPIHGPYHANGELTQSCWALRDYSAGSVTGCGTDGERTCQLVDELDVSQGTEPVASGPTTDELVGIDYATAVAKAGFYREDFYYDPACTAQGDAYLDEHNGHDHDDLGFHYHTTVYADMTPAFPLHFGPNLYGEAGGSFSCAAANGGGMPPPPGT
ncbi:MAG: YHYH protein [Pseudomonadota bacterium]